MFNEKELRLYVVKNIYEIVYPYQEFNIEDENRYINIISLPNNEESAKKIEHVINSYPKILRFLRNKFGVETTSVLSESDKPFTLTTTYTKSNSKYNKLLIQSILQNKFSHISENHLCPEIAFFMQNMIDTLVNIKVGLDFYKKSPPLIPEPVTLFEILFSISKKENDKISFNLKIVERDVIVDLVMAIARALNELNKKLDAERSKARRTGKVEDEVFELYANRVFGISGERLAKQNINVANKKYISKFFDFIKEISERPEFQYLKPLVSMVELFGIEFLETVQKNEAQLRLLFHLI